MDEVNEDPPSNWRGWSWEDNVAEPALPPREVGISGLNTSGENTDKIIQRDTGTALYYTINNDIYYNILSFRYSLFIYVPVFPNNPYLASGAREFRLPCP